MRPAPLIIFIALMSLSLGAAPRGVVVVREGQLVRDGRAVRGIGVNYFDCFHRTLTNPGDTSYDQGFRQLAQHQIPFARFACTGYWPVNMKLYAEDRAEYFRRLDGVVRSAEKHRVPLVPSLFWNFHLVPDLVGEPCDQWGNEASQTRRFMRQYTREIVTRYRNSPAILAWEFGNEYNLAMDLPHAAEMRPPVHVQLGTPATRSERDQVTHEMIRSAVREFAELVRSLDPHRPITSGHSVPRPAAWHLRTERTWTRDAPEQNAQTLRDDHPEPIDMLSVHLYEEVDFERLEMFIATAREMQRPLFIGEFGIGGAGPEVHAQFLRILDIVERSGASLAAVWVFDRLPESGDDYSITAHNERRERLSAIQAANERIARAKPAPSGRR